MKVKLFLFILVPLFLYGGTNIDSLKMELNSGGNEDKYQTLNEIYHYFYERDTDSSFHYAYIWHLRHQNRIHWYYLYCMLHSCREKCLHTMNSY